MSLEQTKSFSEKNVEILMTFGSQSGTCISVEVVTNVSLTVEKLCKGDAEWLYCLHNLPVNLKLSPNLKFYLKEKQQKKERPILRHISHVPVPALAEDPEGQGSDFPELTG